MAEDFFKDISQMGVLGDMLGGMVSGIAGSGLIPKNTPEGKLLAAQSELFSLRKQEAELLLEVGRQAYDENPSAYPQDSKLRLIRLNIAAAQSAADEANQAQEQAGSDSNEKAESDITKEEVRRRYVEVASEFDTPDTRICNNCETRIRDPKLTQCFYCGVILDTASKAEMIKTNNTKQEDTIMANTLSGKYYLIAAETDGQDMMEMMEMMASTMGKSVAEMMFFDFSDDGKVKMEANGENFELDYTMEGNTIKFAVGDEAVELNMDGNTLTGNVNGSKMVFSDTIPAEDESAGESGTVTHALDGLTVTLELPEKGWCTERNVAVWAVPTLFLYNVPSLRKKGFYAPTIEFMTHDSTAEFDLVFDDGFKKRIAIENRNIGGIDMTGRRWVTNLEGMDFTPKTEIENTEYIGVYGENKGIHVQLSDLDIESDEVKAIIDSIKFTLD